MATPMVQAQAVHKNFGRLEVLRGIDLEVAPREVMCIIGPSGSGKSTFLRCVNHLEKIDAGKLSVDGELVGYRQRGDKLYELPDREVCRKRSEIGMVFQSFNLFPHMTALANLIEAPMRVKRESRAVAEERGRSLLDRVGLADKVRRVPQAAVRRPAAARRDRAGPRHAAQADALRRTHLGARPGARGRGARRHAWPCRQMA